MEKDQMRTQISILLPVYNHVCIDLVRNLQQQAEACCVDYEIIVADDGSTDVSTIEANRLIADIHNCIYIVREVNVGRAAIRNFLAETASSEWLLFLDCDIELPDADFIRRYIKATCGDVVDGGVRTAGDSEMWKGNLRFAYEYASETSHGVTARKKNPYRSFRTTNFMVKRAVILACPFDERFRYYGYEDVLFGKRLEEQGRVMKHIDNPVIISDLESNDVFLEKTEEALRTLYIFREELRGYSRLLEVAEWLERFVTGRLLRTYWKIMGRWLRRNLLSEHPSLTAFVLYRLGYYLSLTNKNLKQ